MQRGFAILPLMASGEDQRRRDPRSEADGEAQDQRSTGRDLGADGVVGGGYASPLAFARAA